LEPYQRISQVIFEKWLKDICDKDPLIDVRFGCAVKAVDEERDKVSVTVENTQNGNTVIVTTDYLIGCDGASSQTRKSMGFALDGGPM
jgi:FAD-dependent monooxygenase